MHLIELTDEELTMIAYALKELGNRRAEQACNTNLISQCSLLRNEAEKHHKLSARIYGKQKHTPTSQS